jgi:hypothetical protein
MFNRRIETVEGAKAEHDANQRAIAIARLEKVSKKKHAIKRSRKDKE